jgi:hypothetical protein
MYEQSRKIKLHPFQRINNEPNYVAYPQLSNVIQYVDCGCALQLNLANKFLHVSRCNLGLLAFLELHSELSIPRDKEIVLALMHGAKNSGRNESLSFVP